MNMHEAIEILKKKGYKQTDKREQMLKIFSVENRYLSAKDVLENMNIFFPAISFDTIYRNLSTFVQLGILEMTELDGEKKFRFSCSTDKHHHHLICLTCGITKHIHICPMDQIEQDNEFEIVDHKFEIYGYCKKCL